MKTIKAISTLLAKIFSLYENSMIKEYPVVDDEGNILYRDICITRSQNVIRVKDHRDKTPVNPDDTPVKQR